MNKAEEAKKATTKQTATEKINLKITNKQIETYAARLEMPTLQELADEFCEDEEIEYVTLTSQVASLEKIEVGNATSIFTKLKDYPYEFEINSYLQLASIDGAEVVINDTVTISKEEYEKLKSNYTKLAGVFFSWKTAATWNDAGLCNFAQYDENMCTPGSSKVTIQENGKYLITMASYNANGGGTPTFQLYQNGEMIKQYKNNSTANNVVRTSITLDINEGDVFYGKMYGGGSNPTFFVTTFYKISE